jgi:hypothetical protein
MAMPAAAASNERRSVVTITTSRDVAAKMNAL